MPTTDLHSLEKRHREELLNRRGLAPEWIEVNCRSVTAAQAGELLGYHAKSDGIWLEGCNFQGQFKPDKPWKAGDGKGKPPKYRSSSDDSGGSAKDKYDAMLPLHPAISNYWDDLDALKRCCYQIDGTPCIILTEGFFKAIAGCSHDLPTIALLGVEMGLTPASADPQGKRYLVPTLERYAEAGFGFLIAFDADCATNPNVLAAQRKLAHQLRKFDAPVFIATGLWTMEEAFDDKNKGMDDYIKNHGEDAFRREVLAKAVPWEAWEAQFRKDEETALKEIPPRQAAKELLEGYRQHWKYDLERQTWRRWDKIWIAVQDEVFTQMVYRDLEKMQNVRYGTFSYVENTVKFLKAELLEPQWLTFDRTQWIAFRDCVLEVATAKTHDHAPGFGFVSCLEHDYPRLAAIDPASTLLDALRVHAPTFYSYAMHAQKGDPMKVLKLLAICNGIVKFRFFDLQMFVLLLGVPGAGKSTFARLLETMVGKGNHGSAKLHKLGEDNVLAAIIERQLVICPDEKKAGSDYSGLLSLTGADSIPYRPIYKPQASSRFYGTVVLIANQYPFYGDTTGIARRECLVSFETPIDRRDTSIERPIQEEAGAIMALALALPDAQVTELLTGTGLSLIPDLKRQSWLNKVENDSVALFLEECVVKTLPNDYTPLGGKGGDSQTLYGAYLAFCEENNSKSPFSRQTFRGHFLDLCREIGWNEVNAQRKETGWRVYGVRLRRSGEDTPHVSDLLMASKPPETGKENSTLNDAVPPDQVYRSTEPLPEAGSGSTGGSASGLQGLQQEEMTAGRTALLRETMMLQDWDIVTMLTQSWSQEGKAAVWERLSPEEQATLKQLSAGHEEERQEESARTAESPLKADARIRAVLDDVSELGRLALSLSEEELHEATQSLTPEEIARMKQAASQVWTPGLNRDACYKGERVEIREAGQGREIRVKSRQGKAIFTVKRGDLTPWLGL